MPHFTYTELPLPERELQSHFHRSSMLLPDNDLFPLPKEYKKCPEISLPCYFGDQSVYGSISVVSFLKIGLKHCLLMWMIKNQRHKTTFFLK